MSRKRIKQYLMLLTVVGLIAIAANGSGTFASFSAETTNADNTFATGTLFLHSTANGTTTCTSEDASSNDNFQTNGCGTLFDLSDISPGSLATAHLALTNAGTLAAKHISFYAPTACVSSVASIGTLDAAVSASTTPGSIVIDNLTQTLVASTPIDIADSNGDVITFTVASTVTPATPGSGSTTVTVTGSTDASYGISANAAISLHTPFTETPTQTVCSQAQVTIQEAADNTYDVSGVSECAWPSNLSAACAFPSSKTLADLPDGSTNAEDLSLVSGENGNTTTDLDANGGTRYFVISVKVPDTGSNQNDLQNEQAKVSLTWHIDQA
jgi:hypothetical protein